MDEAHVGTIVLFTSSERVIHGTNIGIPRLRLSGHIIVGDVAGGKLTRHHATDMHVHI